jgi:hypothetical protein
MGINLLPQTSAPLPTTFTYRLSCANKPTIRVDEKMGFWI